jgi:hypothetical protein
MILICSSQLEGSLGIQVEGESRQDLSIDRNSDPLLETKLKEAANKELKELNEEKRKSARRKEYVFLEFVDAVSIQIPISVNFNVKLVKSNKVTQSWSLK